MSVGERIAVGWARAYTAGLPVEVRRARTAEIASDVWEHAAAARAAGSGSASTQRAIAWRCIRGMPADVVWRGTWARRRGLAGRIVAATGWFVALGAFALLVAVPAGSVAGYLLSADADPEWARFAAICAVIVVAEVAGVATSVRRPRLGAALALAGAWGVAAAMWWAWPMTVPLATVATIGWWQFTVRRLRARTAAGRAAETER